MSIITSGIYLNFKLNSSKLHNCGFIRLRIWTQTSANFHVKLHNFKQHFPVHSKPAVYADFATRCYNACFLLVKSAAIYRAIGCEKQKTAAPRPDTCRCNNLLNWYCYFFVLYTTVAHNDKHTNISVFLASELGPAGPRFRLMRMCVLRVLKWNQTVRLMVSFVCFVYVCFSLGCCHFGCEYRFNPLPGKIPKWPIMCRVGR